MAKKKAKKGEEIVQSDDLWSSVSVGLAFAKDGVLIGLNIFRKLLSVGRRIDDVFIKEHRLSVVESIKRRRKWKNDLLVLKDNGDVPVDVIDRELAKLDEDVDYLRKSIRLTGCPLYKAGKCFSPDKRCEDFDGVF